MIIDKSLVPELDKGEIPNKVLAKLIDLHSKTVYKYSIADKYFIASDSTVNKMRLLKDSINNIVISDFPRYITTLNVGFFMSNEVNYSVNEGIDLDPVLDIYKQQTILKIDKLNTTKCSKYGIAYDLTYANKDAEPRSKSISPKNAFIVKANNLEEEILFGVYYVKNNDKEYTVYVFTDKFVLEGICKDLSLQDYAPSIKEHYFGDVPLIEVRNNEECIGDYETVLSLIDAYNIIQSNDVDNIEQFVDAILLLIGAQLSPEQIKLLKETRGLTLPNDAKAEYLTKILDEIGINAALERIRKDIHKFSFTPDMNDENFAGNNSGVALAYKILPFEIMTKDKEAFFKEALRSRFKLYNNFLNIKKNMPIINTSEIEIKFTRALPKNDLEEAQMISYLKDSVTNKTLISNLSFVEDPNEEDELVKKELSESFKQQQNLLVNSGEFEKEE